jgi:hypothetical protein
VNTLDVLRAAREYISDPARWFTQGISVTDGSDALSARLVRRSVARPEVLLGGTRRPPRAVAVPEAWVTRLSASRASLARSRQRLAHARRGAGLFDRAIAVEEAKAAEFTAASEPAPLVAA